MEVLVGCDDPQTMLHGAGGDPNIIGGQRRVGPSQIAQDLRVTDGSAIEDRNEFDSRSVKKLLEPLFVSGLVLSSPEARLELSQDNRTQSDFFRPLKSEFQFRAAMHESRVGRCAAKNPHLSPQFRVDLPLGGEVCLEFPRFVFGPRARQVVEIMVGLAARFFEVPNASPRIWITVLFKLNPFSLALRSMRRLRSAGILRRVMAFIVRSHSCYETGASL